MKIRFFVILSALALLLTGCGKAEAQLPAHWDESFTVIAPFLAAEGPEGFDFGESDDSLALSGIYYATWTAGEKRDFVNADGESTVIFDAQLYVIAQEFRTEADAQTILNQWYARETQTYTCGEAESLTVGSQEFLILPLLSGSETNPYGHGCVAFALRGQNLICVELVCTEEFTEDTRAILEAFLAGLHYDT